MSNRGRRSVGSEGPEHGAKESQVATWASTPFFLTGGVRTRRRMTVSTRERKRQQSYYRATAARYDDMHISKHDEHSFAVSFMVGMLDFLGIESVLDVGSGTGRAISFIKEQRPDIRVVGIEPVLELRQVGYEKGIRTDELIEGDALDLAFGDNEFDLVCEFGVLHHVSAPMSLSLRCYASQERRCSSLTATYMGTPHSLPGSSSRCLRDSCCGELQCSLGRRVEVT